MNMGTEFRVYFLVIMVTLLALLVILFSGCATTPDTAIQPTPIKLVPQHNADFDRLLAETLAESVRAALVELAADREDLQLAIEEIADLRGFVWDEHTDRWEVFLRMNDTVTAQIRELKKLRGEE